MPNPRLERYPNLQDDSTAYRAPVLIDLERQIWNDEGSDNDEESESLIG